MEITSILPCVGIRYGMYGHPIWTRNSRKSEISSLSIRTCQWYQSRTTLANDQDTEFPGVVARPIGKFETSNEYHYQTLRCNVDLLKMIQVGLTLTDENGNSPPGGGTWQFNFKFDLAYVRLSSFLIIAPIHMLKTRSTCFRIQQESTFHRVWITALTRVNLASY
jgi:hypothetical protein